MKRKTETKSERAERVRTITTLRLMRIVAVLQNPNASVADLERAQGKPAASAR